MQNLRINIATIPEEGLEIRLSLPGESLLTLIPNKEECGFTLQPVAIAGTVRKSRQSIFFTGSMKTIMKTSCCRCLEAAVLPVNVDFQYTLLPETETGKEETELQTEDLDVAYYSGEIVDLAPLIAEQIILQIPMKALCQENCRGLCPRCGINLNVGSCNCREAVDDSRLAVLKNFKVK